MPVAVWTMDLAGQECQTTSHYSAPGVSLITLAELFETFWQDGLAASMSNMLTLVGVKADTEPFSAAGTGGIVQASENSSTAVMITKLNAGKPGRFFMPGAPQDAVLPDGRLLSTWRTTALGQLSTALADLATGGVTLGVLGSGSVRDVTDLGIAPVVGIQGRRRFGR